MFMFRLALILTTTLTMAPIADGTGRNAHESASEAVALSDIRHYAQHHFTVIREHPETLGVVENWSPRYDLRWTDFEVSEVTAQTVRIYHATNRHDHSLRFISLWDVDQARYIPWQAVH